MIKYINICDEFRTSCDFTCDIWFTSTRYNEELQLVLNPIWEQIYVFKDAFVMFKIDQNTGKIISI